MTKKIKTPKIEATDLLCFIPDDYLYGYLINGLEEDIYFHEQAIEGRKCDIAITEPGYRYHCVDYRKDMKAHEKAKNHLTKALKALNETVKLLEKARLLEKADKVEVR